MHPKYPGGGPLGFSMASGLSVGSASEASLLHDFFFLSPQMVEDGQSGDLEKKANEVFHCPVCFKEFVCKYGLESHMETHSDNPLR